MEGKEKIQKLMGFMLDEIKEKLQISPYFFINEADFQAYLYSRLIEYKYGFCKTNDNSDNFLVHVEYPRYRKGRRKGRWDIVILKEGRHNSVYFDEASVSVGIELKSHWNSRFKTVSREFYNDEPVRYSDADHKIIFHINVAKKKQHEEDLNKIKTQLAKLKKQNSFFIYLESYQEDNKPKIIIK